MNTVEKGKRLFITMAIVVLAVSLFTTVFSYFMQGSMGLISGIIRTIVEGILLYFVFKGKKWAKIILIFLLSIVIITAIAAIIISFNILLLILLAAYVGSVYIVAISPSVRTYLKSLNH